MKTTGGLWVTGWMLALMLAGTPALAAGGEAALLPVDAVLAALAETETASPADEGADPAAAFRAQVERYQREQPELTEAEAGRRWSDLFKIFVAMDERPSRRGRRIAQPPGMDVLWEALPGPEAWPWIAADTENATLQLIGAVLTNDRDAWWRQLQAAAAVPPAGQEYEKRQARQALASMVEAYTNGGDDPDSLAAALDLRLRLVEEQRAEQPDENQGYYQPLKLPDLVTILGPVPAEAIIRRALRLPQSLEVPAGSETSRLALRLAVAAETDALGAPQWRLAATPDGFALYERCMAQFPSKDRDWQRGSAQAHYLMGLVARGRMAEAVAGVGELQGQTHYLREAGGPLVRGGRRSDVRQFLREALTIHPAIDLWDLYAERTVQDGCGAELIALAQRTLADSPALPNRAEITVHLLRALLGADRLGEAGDLVARAADRLRSDTVAAEARDQADNVRSLGQLAVAAGELLGDEALVENGVRMLRAAVRGSDDNAHSARMEAARSLLEHRRLAEAQAEVVAVMRAKAKARRAGEDRYSWQVMPNDDVLLLAEIYHRAGQWPEVLALFDSAPVWSDTTLADVLWQRMNCNEQATYTLASALTRAGRRDEALRVVRSLLENEPGFDSGYALLLELDPPDLIGYLDELFARDQFEERPLIWKAVVLANRGELAAAEAAVRQAIDVDPTDGDQGPGNRVRAYATLRDILQGRGDTVTAAVLAGLVTAVREAEAGDRWVAAGLASRAIDRYAAGLGFFADAYCIQAKLAVQLARAGRAVEAAAHFQRAFELLPGQVGRMETLCFGCDNVFGGEHALDIADSVFSRLHREQPANPRPAYLLGNLRMEQERYPEAAALYRIAVALDPEYLNAWRKLDELKHRVELPPAARREAVLQLARLNPAGNHARYSADDLGDPALTWRLAETMAGRVREPLAYSVHPAPRPEPATDDPDQEFIRSAGQYRSIVDYRFVPRQAVRQLPAIRALDAWIQLARNRQAMTSVFYISD